MTHKLELSESHGIRGTRMASFGIIGHQTHSSEWKFYKTKQLGSKLVFSPILVVDWVSSYLSFFLSDSTAPTYIFIAPTCATTRITLEPCVWNAEFQHFILRFIKVSLLCGDTTERGIMGEREGKDRVTLETILLCIV
jgi:hypothetical protein